MKVNSLIPNEAINFSNDCTKPPASKFIHPSVEYIPFVEYIPSILSKRISSMATILGVHLVGHNDSSLVNLYQALLLH